MFIVFRWCIRCFMSSLCDLNNAAVAFRCPTWVQSLFCVAATPTPARSDPTADSELHEACKTVNLADIKRILAAGRTDVNCRDERGVTPVMKAAGYGHKELVQFLVSEGADLSLVDDDGDNTLHWVCSGGDVETVKFVLSQNMEVTNAIHRKTAADLARRRGHQEVVDLLVSRGAQWSEECRGCADIDVMCHSRRLWFHMSELVWEFLLR